MRFYALVTPDTGVRPFIHAEIAAPDSLELEEARRHIHEISLFGYSIMLSTHEELLRLPAGRRAIADWHAQNDDAINEDEVKELRGAARQDVEMMALRRGDREAIELLSRGASGDEMAAWLKEEAARDEPKLRAVD